MVKAELAKMSSDNADRPVGLTGIGRGVFFLEFGRVGTEDDNQMEGFRPQCVGR